MLTIGECRICDAGQLGIRRCGKCQELVILCRECDAAWYQSKLEEKPVYADEESMPCPACQASLWSDDSHWVDQDEVKTSSWVAPYLTGLEESH